MRLTAAAEDRPRHVRPQNHSDAILCCIRKHPITRRIRVLPRHTIPPTAQSARVPVRGSNCIRTQQHCWQRKRQLSATAQQCRSSRPASLTTRQPPHAECSNRVFQRLGCSGTATTWSRLMHTVAPLIRHTIVEAWPVGNGKQTGFRPQHGPQIANRSIEATANRPACAGCTRRCEG